MADGDMAGLGRVDQLHGHHVLAMQRAVMVMHIHISAGPDRGHEGLNLCGGGGQGAHAGAAAMTTMAAVTTCAATGIILCAAVADHGHAAALIVAVPAMATTMAAAAAAANHGHAAALIIAVPAMAAAAAMSADATHRALAAADTNTAACGRGGCAAIIGLRRGVGTRLITGAGVSDRSRVNDHIGRGCRGSGSGRRDCGFAAAAAAGKPHHTPEKCEKKSEHFNPPP